MQTFFTGMYEDCDRQFKLADDRVLTCDVDPVRFDQRVAVVGDVLVLDALAY